MEQLIRCPATYWGKQCIRKILSPFLTHPKLYLCQMGDLVPEAEVVYYPSIIEEGGGT